jgi:hypothetical protein
VAIVVVLAFFSGSYAREWIPLLEGTPSEEAVAEVLSSDESGTLMEVEIPGLTLEPSFRGTPGSVRLSIPGAASTTLPGAPELPVVSFLLAVPDLGDVSLEIVSRDERVLDGYDVAPVRPYALEGRQPQEAVADPSIYGSDTLYPAELAVLGEPAVFRDLRVVSVRVNPVRVNPVTRKLHVTERVRVRLNYGAGAGVNPRSVARSFRSAAFEPLYRSLVDNYDLLPRAEVRRGSYLIITADGYAASLAPLVEWKRSRGIETELVLLSTIGASPTNQDIKDYIQNAYETWPSPPDYVLLVGDSTTSTAATIPCWYLPAIPFSHVTDHPYTELDGTDYFPEVIIGRMSVDAASEAAVASLKVLSYERDCDAATDDWYGKALMVAGNYGATPPPTSPRQTVLRVREMLYDCGYAQVDTVFYPPYVAPNPIGSMIDSGVGIVNYRGWGAAQGWHYPEYYVDDINSLSNGKMLPIMTSCVCGTGNWESWGYDPCFAEAWIRAGTPADLKGGPVAYGPSDFNTHTRWNNAVGSGIYQGLLYEGLDHFGQATVRSKFEVWKWFVDEREGGDWVDYYYNVYNVVGDPELWVRLEAPEDFIVTHDASVPFGKNNLLVKVTDSAGDVVPGAEVILYKENEFIESRVLAGSDRVLMPLPAETAGTTNVTVVAAGFKPYTGSAEVVTSSGPQVAYLSHGIDDDSLGASSGNGDGAANPGETIELVVTLRNYGLSTASGVTCSFSSLDNSQWVNVPTPQVVTYGTITAGGSASGSGPFVFEVADGCPEGTELKFLLEATDGSRATYESEVRVTVGAAALSYYSVSVGGDGVLDPGETAALTVTLENEGPIAATSVSGTLRTPPSGLTAPDAGGYWGTVSAGGMATNSGNTFQVTAAADVADGHEFLLAIDLTGDAGLAQYVVFPLVVGTQTTADPSGADEHGYYCYDDTDTGYGEAPTYSWIEIDPSYGGSGTDLGMAYDEMVDVALPFSFRYYGEEFDTIGICSNGNIGMGSQPVWEHQPRNTPIGAPLGPAGMIAPFWDDLDPAASGKVLYENLGSGRFAVEWSRVQTTYVDTTSLDPYYQTFQLILYDQDVYPTESGDGEIVFQYHTIANADTANGATVGIENLNETDGLEYSFFAMYPDYAAPLAAGRAVKFTTDPPDGYLSTGVDEGEPRGVALLGNRPNPFNPMTAVAFSVPGAAHVDLAVYDISGRRVATLAARTFDGGNHEVVWNGTNDAGERVASGIYFCRLTAMGEERSAKMVLLK